MDLYDSDTYLCDLSTVKDTIKKFGVAVIPNILSDEECANMVDGAWSFLEKISKDTESEIKKDVESTWRNFYSLYPLHSMLIQHHQVGHSQFIWNIRQNINVVKAYATIWDCSVDDMLVSFDGMSFHIPPEKTNKGWNRNKTWYHVDQSFTNNKFSCVQGMVSGLDVNKGDATFAFYEKSHLYHEEFAKKFNITDKNNWYKLKTEEEAFYKELGLLEKRISCPKGSLILWDSRLLHCGVEAYKGRENPNFRCVVYVCYQPRMFATKKEIEKKQKAYNEKRLTSHWPCKIKLFPKNPRTYGGKVYTFNSIDPPTLTTLGKKLAGF